MLKKLKKIGQKGDTIIEVMIVLAVLGLAISISYATSSRSLLNARQAQENTEATELAQSQLEAIRVLAGNNTPSPGQDVYINTGFCTVPAAGGYDIKATSSATPTPDCNVKNLYDVLVLYCGTSNTDPHCSSLKGPALDNFVAVVTWDDVRGDGQDSIQLIYRYHKP